MKKIYYKIMISSIYAAKNNGIMSDIWKYASSFYFAFATSIYLLFMYSVVNNYLLNHQLDFFKLKIILNGKYNFILNMVIYFVVPIMSVNYLLIFKENRYKELIKEYNNSYNKKLFAWYFMISIVFMYATLFLKK
ncbi:hypothetical protein [Flavobacterium aciduliphilum]|uniref:Uncharacterized protein n=1 Tax=Flavobacterium aciduliphilum TaxID=1101402 RepID=A0A328YIX8_9FLAO|nr:hypothetical protein [Flavobacterium aciduliphilum]RAR74108.1 hypothetical protein CLV55_10236 [Flavobacterium aciduliphilum]